MKPNSANYYDENFEAAQLTVCLQILFYEDPQVIAGLQKTFPLYADKFPQWSEHSSGMHTYVRKYSCLMAAMLRPLSRHRLSVQN